jgi:hypothetical protein
LKGGVAVIDPLPAFPTRSEWDTEEYDSGRRFLRPAILDTFYALASTHLRRHSGLFVVVNQKRERAGIFFGDPWESTCLEVVDHFDVLLDLARIQALKEHGAVVGNRFRVKVKKNAGSAPFQETEFDILNHTGPDLYGNLFEVALAFDVVAITGDGYVLDGEVLGRSQRDAQRRFIELYRDGQGAAIRAALPGLALLPGVSA